VQDALEKALLETCEERGPHRRWCCGLCSNLFGQHVVRPGQHDSTLVLSYFHFMAFPVKMFAAEFPVYGLVFEVGS
jgi:hypothetical protein